MFLMELFEEVQKKTVVILPGGFHPFHPGHLSLYQSAQKSFPGADIYYAATDDKSQRPFNFADKQTLATISGVPKGHFVQVKSPFQAKEIVGNYDPDSTVVIFARSEKDKDKPPFAGGIKKDGTPSYLQAYTDHPEAASKHAYMVYLPTIEFKAGTSGITSATQIREKWPVADAATKERIAQDLYPADPEQAQSILDKYLGEGVAEGTAGRSEEKSKNLLRKARIAHPLAKSDEEALALYILDKEQKDVQDLERVNDKEERMISNLQNLESELEKKMHSLRSEIDAINQKISALKEASGYIPKNRREARDPRWSHALTVDVHTDTLKKEIKKFFPTKPPKTQQTQVKT